MQGTGGKEGSAKDQMLETGSPICERTGIVTMYVSDFPGGIADKNPPANTGDMGLISGPGRLELLTLPPVRHHQGPSLPAPPGYPMLSSPPVDSEGTRVLSIGI